jgi:hypothetical protein
MPVLAEESVEARRRKGWIALLAILLAVLLLAPVAPLLLRPEIRLEIGSVIVYGHTFAPGDAKILAPSQGFTHQVAARGRGLHVESWWLRRGDYVYGVTIRFR